MDYEMDFLDPYEELEMRYAEEMELLREMEDNGDTGACKNVLKKSLNFEDVPSTSGVSVISESRPQENDIVKELSPLPLAELDTSISHVSDTIMVAVAPEAGYSHSVKRTAEDLFGDINDLDFDETHINKPIVKNKRAKVEITTANGIDHEDSFLIAQIMQRKRQKEGNPTNCFDVCETANRQKRASECTLTRRVPKWSFISLRNGKNEKFYAKLHSDELFNSKVESITKECKNLRLLSVSFEDVMMEANAILDKKFSDQEKALRAEEVNSHESRTDVTELWVQKYKPVAYLDLLSDEGTNRTLLKWIKLWDKIVFNREPKIRLKNKQQSNNFNFGHKNYPDLDEELDASGCPKYKIVLLCGPPGLGKTTLAHLVAKHAGYNVVEMNASDDRSPETFMIQLEAATQMKAVIGKNPKPNCLIIDEIDGAPAPSIDVLVKFVNGEMKTKSKKKVTKTSITLRRPIICICNDMYVPALRTLRQMAFVIHFPPTSLSRLARRLVEIAEAENIKTDTGAMTTLCEKTNNDIRTCLSTIYCLKDQPIGIATVKNTNVGMKDVQRGLFTVWQEIFQIPLQKMEDYYNFIELKKKYKTDNELFMAIRWHSILRSVQGNSDYDRLAQGVYENFLNVKFNDSSMRKVSRGLEWFCFMDEMKTSILTTQVYTLLAYMPYCFIMWGFLFSVYQRTKLNFPNLMFELNSRQTKYSQIVREVLKGMEPSIRAHYHYEPLLLDTLPYFAYILNPSLRTVSIQLFTSAEKDALRQLVNTMIDYNLNFVQERTQDGNYEFNMDPDIEEVVEFSSGNKAKNLTYSLKMMIAQEIEQEKLRRLEDSLWKHSLNDNCVPMEEDPPADTAEDAVAFEPVSTQNHLQKLTPKIIKKSPTCSVTRDFFGRIVDPATTKKAESEKVDNILKSDIWFHFKEGFSNAVRRSVYMKDLLK